MCTHMYIYKALDGIHISKKYLILKYRRYCKVNEISLLGKGKHLGNDASALQG